MVSCATGADTSVDETTRARIAEARDAITHGAATDGDPAVVGLVYSIDGGGDRRAIRCTGALVAPRWVLTAAHCLEPMAPEAVAFGSSLTDSAIVPLRALVVHPDFDRDSLDHDLALVELALPAPTTPLAVAAGVQPRAGEAVRLVGFGRGDTAAPPRKRTGSARIVDVTRTEITVEPAPSLTCSGDSGGPALWTTDGEELLIAVVSRGDWECEEHSVFTRLAEERDFLHATITAAETEPTAAGCTIRPATRDPRGAPSSLALPLALVGLFAAAARCFFPLDRRRPVLVNQGTRRRGCSEQPRSRPSPS
jgi:secreted trypsin-like serine protease